MDINNPYLSSGGMPRFRPGNKIGCLCLHGFSAAPAEIDWLADHLHHTLGMTTYTPRYAGHGRDYRDMRRMRWEDWYMSARDGYQLLRESCEQVFVAGISMGGLLALLITAAADTTISGAAVIAAPTHFTSERVGQARFFKYLQHWSYTPDRTNLPQIVREEQQRRGEPIIGRTHYARWSVSAVAELNKTAEVARSHLYQITAPLSLIYTAQDTAVPLSCSDYIARHVKSAIIEQHTLDKSMHIITQDIQRDEAFTLIEQFFVRILQDADYQRPD